MDNRSSLSALEADDVTMITLSQELDQHTANLRSSVLQSVANIRCRIHSQASEAIEHHALTTRATEQRLTMQIDNLQDLLETRTAELERERNLTQKLQDMIFSIRKRDKDKAAAAAALHAWRDHVARRKRLDQASKLLIQRKQEREARAAFQAWRFQSLSNKFESQIAKQVSDHRKEILKMTAAHQASENASRIEILALKEKIAKDEEQRSALEEKMKAAFMRGVCALNVEAMQVLRGGAVSAHGQEAESGQQHQQQQSISNLLENIASTLGQGSDALKFPLHAAQNSDGEVERLVARQGELDSQISKIAQRPPVGSIASTAIQSSALPAASNPQHLPFTVTVNPSYGRPSSAHGAHRTGNNSQRISSTLMTNTIRPSTTAALRSTAAAAAAGTSGRRL